jgi:hypothetical protein
MDKELIELDKLKAERKRLKEQMKRNEKRLEELYEKIHHLEHKELLSSLMGQPGAVRVTGDPWKEDGEWTWLSDKTVVKLKDKTGTVREILRTRCRVEFDGQPTWTLPLRCIVPTKQPEGLTIPL